MSEGTLAFDELAALLERFPLERAGNRTLEQITEAQVQLLLARIAALTDAVRGRESSAATRLASRILLDDLFTVAAQFRGRTNDIGASLAKALEDLQHGLARGETGRESAPRPGT